MEKSSTSWLETDNIWEYLSVISHGSKTEGDSSNMKSWRHTDH